jgi:glycosyltransferase involved in cell wall biosynthesis
MEVSPKFTVITICYNAEKTIQSTIESVNDQSVKSIQHLIIDGASSDSTLDICEKFKHNYTEIISEPDDGIY